MEDQTPTIVKNLQTRQAELKLIDARFAELLGISRPLWWMTRNGQREVNISLLRGVARAFPEMHDQIVAFLQSGNVN